MGVGAAAGAGRRGWISKGQALRAIGLAYLGLLLVVPVAMVFWGAFKDGLAPVIAAVTRPAAVSALVLTVGIAIAAVVANTVFGVWCALVLVRGKSRFKPILNALVDLPLAVSPVVIGLALLAVYGRAGWWGEWFISHGLPVIFSVPGMVLATAFVSLPFVVREVAPVLRELGTEQEQAAATLGASKAQILWRITLPSVKRAIAFGVVLTTARALGEFGAVSVVSGRVAGRTQTLTVYVEERFQAFDMTGAYTASVVLAVLALLTLVFMRRLAAVPAEARA
jgi:sulfate transport system permease protein